MKKIPCVFQRDFSNKQSPKLLETVTPGCEWVLAGEGTATRKWDGTACLVRDGKLYKRYDAKKGKEPPVGFISAQEPDAVTGHHPGWLLVDVVNPEPADVWHAMTWWQTLATYRGWLDVPDRDGTYELTGPRINSGHEGVSSYLFVRHGSRQSADYLADAPRTFAGLRDYLAKQTIEGIVFWRGEPGVDTDCDMAKITREHFGLPWPVKK